MNDAISDDQVDPNLEKNDAQRTPADGAGTGERAGQNAWLRAEIVERERAETALRDSEERFRQFAENSVDVFWIMDAETLTIEYLNPVYEKIFGQSRAMLVRDRAKRLEVVHPADRKAASAGIEEAKAGKNFVRHYRLLRPPDGETRRIRDTVFPIRDETGKVVRLAGVAQDVTEETESTERLRESEERFRFLVEGAKEYAIFMIDPTNTIVHWNRGAERVFGWTAKEAVGQAGRLIFTPEDRKRKQEEKEISTAMRNGNASDRRWHMRKDGSRVWVDGVMHRLDDEGTGALRGFAKIARDATDERTAAKALQRAHDDLEYRVRQRTAELWAANAELQEEISRRAKLEQEILLISEREKRRIGQDLHDSLCQELAAAAFLLESTAKKLREKKSSEASTVSEAAQIVNANVGLARDLARGLHPIELGGGLSAALRELTFRTHGKIGCRFEGQRSVDVPDPSVAFNLYRIAQEAVTNAVKHGKPSEIVISLRRTKEGIVMTIWDNGEGFDAKKDSKGMGIHIMTYRANAIGAKWSIESPKNKGTCVSCIVPAKKTVSPSRSRPRSPAARKTKK